VPWSHEYRRCVYKRMVFKIFGTFEEMKEGKASNFYHAIHEVPRYNRSQLPAPSFATQHKLHHEVYRGPEIVVSTAKQLVEKEVGVLQRLYTRLLIRYSTRAKIQFSTTSSRIPISQTSPTSSTAFCTSISASTFSVSSLPSTLT
jgi:hypothetical protein